MKRIFKKTTLKTLFKKNPTQFESLLSKKRKIREKKMNKTETAFSEMLEEARKTGKIQKWHFEEITLKIAPNTRYTPDFVAVLPNGHWQVFEIKGHLEDDAAVKFKTACEKFPEISFQMLRRKKGEWTDIYNLPSPYNTPQWNLTEPKKTKRKP